MLEEGGLARDIGERGQLDLITLYQGMILDGRRRYRACLRAGVAPKVENYAGDDPLGFVLSRNVHCRHPTQSQLAMMGARLANLPLGANKQSQGVSIGTASVWLNVSLRSILRARKVLTRGIPDLVKAVDNGTISIWKAFGIAKLPESEQRAALDRIAGYKPPAVEGRDLPSLPAGEPSEAQVEASATRNATGSAEAEAETPAAEQPRGSSSPPSTSMPSTAAGTAGSPGIPRYNNEEWIWPGYIPTSAVTVIVGSINAPTNLVVVKVAATVIAGGCWPNSPWAWARSADVAWLSAQPQVERTLHDRVMAAGGILDGEDQFHRVHLLEANVDMFKVPIYHLAADLGRLDQIIQATGEVRVAVVDYLFPYVASGIEQNLACLQRATAAMN